MKKHWYDYLWIVSLTYLILGFFNILFAWIDVYKRQLIGPSGGGKTTVSRLAARFWDATRGTITVGGMNVAKTDPETLMGLYSIVFQDVTLSLIHI